MSKVIYDGEEVSFQGAPPQNVGHLMQLLRHNAAQAGRVMVSFTVDGRDAMENDVDLNTTTYTHVEVKTAPEKELFLKAIDNTLAQMPAADAAIDPLLESLLSDSWEEAFGKVNHFLQGMAGFLELLVNLADYAQRNEVNWHAQLREDLKKIDATFVKLVKMCENQEVAELTGLLNNDFRAIYVDSLALVKGSVRSTFAK